MPISRDGAALRLKDDDNVAVCLRPVAAGTELDFGTTVVTARVLLPAGHKVAVQPIQSGDLILKYGQTIGRAVSAIAPGEHVHVHNVEGTRGRGDLAENPVPAAARGGLP